MPDVPIAPQDINRVAGLAASFTGSLSASDTYTILNNGRVFLHFKKTGAGDCTVTVDTPNTVDGNAIADKTFTVPATTGDLKIGPFPPNTYNTSGKLRVGLSEITGLTVAAVRME